MVSNLKLRVNLLTLMLPILITVRPVASQQHFGDQFAPISIEDQINHFGQGGVIVDGSGNVVGGQQNVDKFPQEIQQHFLQQSVHQQESLRQAQVPPSLPQVTQPGRQESLLLAQQQVSQVGKIPQNIQQFRKQQEQLLATGQQQFASGQHQGQQVEHGQQQLQLATGQQQHQQQQRPPGFRTFQLPNQETNAVASSVLQQQQTFSSQQQLAFGHQQKHQLLAQPQVPQKGKIPQHIQQFRKQQATGQQPSQQQQLHLATGLQQQQQQQFRTFRLPNQETSFVLPSFLQQQTLSSQQKLGPAQQQQQQLQLTAGQQQQFRTFRLPNQQTSFVAPSTLQQQTFSIPQELGRSRLQQPAFPQQQTQLQQFQNQQFGNQQQQFLAQIRDSEQKFEGEFVGARPSGLFDQIKFAIGAGRRFTLPQQRQILQQQNNQQQKHKAAIKIATSTTTTTTTTTSTKTTTTTEATSKKSKATNMTEKKDSERDRKMSQLESSGKNKKGKQSTKINNVKLIEEVITNVLLKILPQFVNEHEDLTAASVDIEALLKNIQLLSGKEDSIKEVDQRESENTHAAVTIALTEILGENPPEHKKISPTILATVLQVDEFLKEEEALEEEKIAKSKIIERMVEEALLLVEKSVKSRAIVQAKLEDLDYEEDYTEALLEALGIDVNDVTSLAQLKKVLG